MTIVMPSLAVQALEERQDLAGWCACRGCRSARRRAAATGRFTSARAIATRCCWPPESWLGRWSLAAREADRAQRRARALALLGGRHAAVDQRQLDVLERARAREQVEALEDEADARGCGSRRARRREARDVAPAEPVAARWSARSRQPRTFMNVDLPGARRAHHRDELAARDLERDARERLHPGLPQLVDAPEVAHLDQRAPPRPSSPAPLLRHEGRARAARSSPARRR